MLINSLFKDKDVLFTDGASKGNPGSSGWGVIKITAEGEVHEYGGYEGLATNNQMELLAAIRALSSVSRLRKTLLITDSSYVLNGINSWIKKWKSRDWKTTAGRPVINQEYWLEISNLVSSMQKKDLLHCLHVPAHVGIPGNERVDQIASQFSLQEDLNLYRGSLGDYLIDINDLDPKTDLKTKKASESTWYLSYLEGKLVRHKTWRECEKRVKGKRNALFRKVTSKKQEEEVLEKWKVN